MSLSKSCAIMATAALVSTTEAAYYASREHHHPEFHRGGHGWKRSGMKLPTITDFDSLVPEFFEMFGRRNERNSFSTT